ncbi:MAG: flagellar hook-associated protein FlgK [Ignavibacteria bacterium]
MGLSGVFNIASRSLGVYQQALNVTSNNVANSNNADYARQKVILGSEITNGSEWGTGVKIEDVQRVKNNLLDTQIRSYNDKYSDASKRAEVLGQVEALYSEPSDQGLSSLITQFFNSWDQLAVTPNSTSLRSNVVEASKRMTTKIQSAYEGLTQIKDDLLSQTNLKLQELNTTLKNVQTLNKQIASAKASNQSSNTLMDSRDKAIDSLSTIANISVNYDQNGSANISIGGVFAVDSSSSTQFKAVNENGKIVISNMEGTSRPALKGGELFALTDMYSNTITGYQTGLDTIASTIMTQVNQVHKQGYDMSATSVATMPNGVDFFSAYSNGTLQINENIVGNTSTGKQADLNKIAVSISNQNGNGTNAINIATLANTKAINGQTIGDYYSTMVTGIGTEKQLSDQNTASNKLVLDQFNAQKTSYSGVSIDEEMTNVIKFQRSYDASAKLIKVADELLQTLMQMV